MSLSNAAVIEIEIRDLEARLREARARLSAASPSPNAVDPTQGNKPLSVISRLALQHPVSADSLHNLFLLSDSALPLGSFAFSSGLESFLAHSPRSTRNAAAFSRFLTLSLASLASTTLPFVVAGFEHPDVLETLDNDLDAGTTCVVAKRASVKQGRALLAVWERSFRQQLSAAPGRADGHAETARSALESFSSAIKLQNVSNVAWSFGAPELHGHLPPLFGTTCAALSIVLAQALYMYLFNHAKTVVSAGIRASVLGPYQAQGVLASEVLRSRIWALVEDEIGVDGKKTRKMTDQVGQCVPMLDIWGGRHEIVYSRIFNS